MKNINIVIADDHTLFLQGISSILSGVGHIDVVGIAENGEEVLSIIENKDVDLIITDLSMPVMSGIDLIEKVKKDYPQIKIIAVTMHNQTKIITNALRKGADGYLLKNTEKEELVEAINQVIKGEKYISNEVKSAVMEQMAADDKTQHSNLIPDLSEREKEVLNLIANEHTQLEISEKLFISTHTVVFHKRKLFHKFNVNNTAGLVKKAMDMGLID